MEQNRSFDPTLFSLHDCRAERISFTDRILSFFLSEGFLVSPQHPQNSTENWVRTDAAQVNFFILDEAIDGITVYLFRKTRGGKTVREEWEPDKFFRAVNNGTYQLEFISRYEGFQSLLFQCAVWFDRAPYHMECELILHTDRTEFCWNRLREDRPW